MKYIDADLLRKEVKRLEESAHRSALDCADSETRKFHEGKDYAYQHVSILINSLQQEQPEVDFEKEIEKMWNVFIETEAGRGAFSNIARHFYELGKNSK